MPIEIISVKLEIINTKVKEKLERIISSIEGFGVQQPGTSGFVDLLILETGEDINKGFNLLDSLIESGIATEIFLTSSRTDQEILIQALRKGVKEFFPQPINDEEVKSALLKFRERRKEPSSKKKKEGKIINIISAKGGVGATTVAVNLATSLVELKGIEMVALADLSPQLGEISLFLDVKPTYHWGDIAKNINRMDTTYLMSVLSKHSSGLYFLPSPPNWEDTSSIKPDSLAKILGVMKEIFDFIVIDSGQAISNFAKNYLELLDNIFIVSVLNLPCLANTERLLETFYRLNYPMEDVKIVFNRYLPNSDISLKDGEKTLNKKHFWIIPNDFPTAMSSLNQGKPISVVEPRSEISRSFKTLAASITEKDYEDEKKDSRLKFWKLKK
ncbi:MAG: AAA family ATPase [Pseudomonadota bacterium]